MTGDLFDARRVDDDFLLRDAHRQHLADERPRHRVEVQTIGDVAFDVDVAIKDQSGIEVGAGQRQEVRLLAFPAFAWRFLEVPQTTHVGDLGEPPRGDLVEMFQGIEGAAIQEASFDVVELAFDLAFGLGPTHLAGPGTEAVVGGKGQETGIVDRAVGVVTQHHRLEVVVQAHACQAAEVMEGVHVLTQRGR